MNNKIAICSSATNVLSVIIFAFSMVIGTHFGSYLASLFIALSFVPFMCAFCFYAVPDKKLAGYTSMVFASVYVTVILLVYFAQLTTVRLDSLQGQALNVLDFQQFGLFFNYDLLGYGLMALSTFFAGLTVVVHTKEDRWLKILLMIHGAFFLPCITVPMLGLFSLDRAGDKWIGTALLLFWCAYFIPVGVLSIVHFVKKVTDDNREKSATVESDDLSK